MIALIYDVHGNLPALEAVLAEAEAVGVERWVLGGDYAAFGGWPVECLARLRELPDATWIRGNWERWADDTSAIPDQAPLHEAARALRAALGDEEIMRLAALPIHAEVEGTLVVHGSPRSDVESFAPEAGPEDEALLAGSAAPRVVFGHTHLQFRRTGPRGTELVNPGSVGLPFDGDTRAAWALLGPDGVELRRTAYDVERAAAAVPEGAARRLREARL